MLPALMQIIVLLKKAVLGKSLQKFKFIIFKRKEKVMKIFMIKKSTITSCLSEVCFHTGLRALWSLAKKGLIFVPEHPD
jgi:hypothetical protein